jgi:hypothetical protein
MKKAYFNDSRLLIDELFCLIHVLASSLLQFVDMYKAQDTAAASHRSRRQNHASQFGS